MQQFTGCLFAPPSTQAASMTRRFCEPLTPKQGVARAIFNFGMMASIAACAEPHSPNSDVPLTGQDSLIVAISAGVVSSLSVGRATREHGSSVQYSFALKAGFSRLKVQIDGQDASVSGTFIMQSARSVSATADSLVFAPDAEEDALDLWRGLVDQAADPTFSRVLLDRLDALAQRRSPAAADTLLHLGLIRTARNSADIAALHRILSRADSLRAATASATFERASFSRSKRSSSATLAGSSPDPNSVVIEYVNGIWSDAADAMPKLTQLLASALPDVAVRAANNPSGSDPTALKLSCLAEAEPALDQGEITTVVTYLTACDIAITGLLAPKPGDLLESFAQYLGTPYLSQLVSRSVTDKLIAQAIGNAAVVLIGHSQGNFVIQDALSAFRQAGWPRECLGYVAVASPRPPASSATAAPANQLTVGVGDYGPFDPLSTAIDLITIVPGSHDGDHSNELSKKWADRIGDPRWALISVFPLSLVPRVRLHWFVPSYLETAESSAILKANIVAQVKAVRQGCAAARGVLPSAVQLLLAPNPLSLNEGETATLLASARSASGADVTVPLLTWSSSDPTIASVSQTGTVIGVRGGTANIIISTAGAGPTLQALTRVVVNAVPVTRVGVRPTNISLEVAQSVQLVADAYGPNGQSLVGRTVSWTSVNSSIATVTANGRATAIALGNTQIRALVAGVTGSSDLAITPSTNGQPFAALTAAPTSIAAGESSTLTWSSTNATACVGDWVNVPTGAQVPISGSATVNPSATTTYHIVCSATAGGPTGSASATVTVTAPASPSVTTQAATNVAQTSFVMNGAINPNGISTSGYFEWDVTPNLSSVRVTSPAALGSGTNAQGISAPLSGAVCNSTYYFRAVGANANNSVVRGSIVAATTAACSSPTASLNANPASITAGQSSTLSWNSSNATACVGDWVNAPTGAQVPTNGSATVTPTATTTYHIVCSSTAGGPSANSSATITVTALGPTVTTQPASSVTQSGFVMNGTINPNGTSTSGYFEWDVTSNLISIHVTSPVSVGSSTNAQGISAPLSGASCNSTYYFRAVGANANNSVVKGSIVAATTAACATPTASLSASPMSITAGQSSTLTWSSSNATACVGDWVNPPAGAQVPTSGSASVSPSVTTTYNVSCSATAGGPIGSAAATVTVTALGPTVTTQSASNVTRTGFVMNGTINPNGVATSGYFEWDVTSNLSSVQVTSPASVGSGTTAQGISAPLSGAACNSTYYYRAVGANANNSVVRGSIVGVSTAACATPTATLNASPTSITAGQSSTLTWSSTNATACVGDWVNAPTGGQVPISGSATVNPSATTTYHIACSATVGGPTGSASATVTVTAPASPSVTTQAATNVMQTGFRFNGVINPNGVSTSGYFEWSSSSPTLNASSFTSAVFIGAQTTNVGYFQDLFGGLCGHTYWYRAIAVNQLGASARGSIVSVTTSACF
jgi:hypothetical protein